MMRLKPKLSFSALPCLQWLMVALASMLIAGCAGSSSSSRVGASADPPETQAGTDNRGSRPGGGALDGQPSMSIEQRLRSEVRQWRGTPHRLGGVTRQGIDCSGFVQMLYREILNRRIPRSTALQIKSGHSINKSRLSAGDLVFFKLPDDKRHVGIYLGHKEFAHASTSRGVMISDLDSRYWRNSYWTARRYLDPPD